MLDNDILSVYDEHLDEIPPPYTELDDSQFPLEDDIPALYPTDMTITTDGEMATAQQLLRPGGHGISLQLEAIQQTTVHVYPDNENSYQGLISIQAKFYRHEQAPDNHVNSQAPAIVCETTMDEKSSQLQHVFRPPDVLDRICCSLKVVLPQATAATEIVLPELLLRLPRDSQLTVQNIREGVVGRLDAAVIQGAAELRGVSADNLRMVVGNGSVDLVDVSVQTAARFVVVHGDIHLRQCSACKNIIVKAQQARISMHAVSSRRIDVYGGSKPINGDSIQAEVIHVHSDSGYVSIDCSAEELVVKSNTGPVHGAWNVSRMLDINAASAIVRGSVEFSGDAARARIRARSWPVSLAVSKEYLGHYNVRAINSVVNFGLPRGTRYESHPHWCQGVIGIAAHVLDVESINAPVVISGT